MATQDKIDSLNQTIIALGKIDYDKVLRPAVGRMSVKEDIGDIIAKLISRLKEAVELCVDVSNRHVDQLIGTLNNFHAQFNTQSEMDDAAFAANRAAFIDAIMVANDQFIERWLPFDVAKFRQSGLADDENFKKTHKESLENIKLESADIIQQVKDEASQVIEKAKAEANSIKKAARKTATKISIEAAQEQFDDARDQLKNQIWLWSILSILGGACFFGVSIWFYIAGLPSIEDWYSAVYKTVMRIVILTANGAVVAFFLRMFRAHLHMYQHNSHRKRLANSMAAFVESAITDTQRDLILTHLVDAIATFGSSGILQQEDDNLYSPKMTVDTITRNITAAPGTS